MADPTLRVAIAGTGMAGRYYHLPSFQRQEGVDVVAFIETDLPRARAAAAEHGVPSVYGTLDEALARERIDVVSICTPPSSHYDLAKLSLQHGCHVFMEKPMTDTVEQAAELVALARTAGRHLCIVHQHKFNPGILKLIELVRAGVLGDILQLDLAWLRNGDKDRMVVDPNWWVHQMVGGRFVEAFPHQAYIARELVGPITLIDVRAERQTTKWPWMRVDNAHALLKSRTGWVNIRMSSSHTLKRGDLGLIHGTHASAVFDYRRVKLHPLKVRGGARLFMEQATAKRARRIGQLMDRGPRVVSPLHMLVIERFVEALRGRGDMPTSPEEAYEIMDLTHRFAVGVDAASRPPA